MFLIVGLSYIHTKLCNILEWKGWDGNEDSNMFVWAASVQVDQNNQLLRVTFNMQECHLTCCMSSARWAQPSEWWWCRWQWERSWLQNLTGTKTRVWFWFVFHHHFVLIFSLVFPPVLPSLSNSIPRRQTEHTANIFCCRSCANYLVATPRSLWGTGVFYYFISPGSIRWSPQQTVRAASFILFD